MVTEARSDAEEQLEEAAGSAIMRTPEMQQIVTDALSEIGNAATPAAVAELLEKALDDVQQQRYNELPLSKDILLPTETENGKIETSRKYSVTGDPVTITATPDEGYVLDTLTVTDAQGRAIELTDLGGGQFRFIMPEGNVNVNAVFTEAESGSEPADDVLSDFTDLIPGEWYADAIEYCVERGLMDGLSDTEFGPNTSASRAMIVTMLWRLSGEPEAEAELPFTDVADGAWYAEAIRWAASEGIVLGYEDGTCRPEQLVTREELAAVLYRFAQKQGEGFKGAWMFLLPFEDRAEISGWADEAMHWCSMHGIILGRTETLIVPGEDATRAEAAAMLMRFCKELEK